MASKKYIRSCVRAVSKSLGLKDVDVQIGDIWATGVTVWGFADIARNSISLHFVQNNWKNTIRHELCHLAAKQHGHGERWQSLMRKTGQK